MNKLCIVGELRPKSRFLGNSVSTVMEGENRVYLLGRPEDGRKYTDRRSPGSFFNVIISLCGFYAEHVCPGDPIW